MFLTENFVTRAPKGRTTKEKMFLSSCIMNCSEVSKIYLYVHKFYLLHLYRFSEELHKYLYIRKILLKISILSIRFFFLLIEKGFIQIARNFRKMWKIRRRSYSKVQHKCIQHSNICKHLNQIFLAAYIPTIAKISVRFPCIILQSKVLKETME